MSAPIIQPGNDCCTPCQNPLFENVPGPQGNPGTPGANGTDGVNAFTTTTAQFTQPAVSSNVNVSVVNSAWAAVGQEIFIATGGYYLVAAIVDTVTLTVTNQGYTGNAVPTTVITSAQKVTPAGVKGADGSSPADALLKANNLSDVTNAGTSRTNLGLGSLAVLSSVNNGNWSGTALAISNGGTGQVTSGAALTALGGQPLDGMLTALAALVTANNDMLYFTGADTPTLLNSTTAFGRSGLLDASATAARSRMGSLLPRYGCLGFISGVNLNSATTDNAFTIESANYRIDKLVVKNASISLTTATAGLFTAAGGAGTTIAADQSLAALTASTKFKDLTLQTISTTDLFTPSTLYFRVGTAQGSAATADVFLFGWKFD